MEKKMLQFEVVNFEQHVLGELAKVAFSYNSHNFGFNLYFSGGSFCF